MEGDDVYQLIITPCLEQLLKGTSVITVLGSIGIFHLLLLTHLGVKAGVIIHITLGILRC